MMNCGSHQVLRWTWFDQFKQANTTNHSRQSEKQRNRRILKWNTVNYVLCEIITGAIVCQRISGCISFPLPSTSISNVSRRLYVYICVKYYCNNNGNNLFMSFSWVLFRLACRLPLMPLLVLFFGFAYSLSFSSK